MTYTAFAILFMLAAVGVGARSAAARRPAVAVGLAGAMVAVQFALLMSS